MADYEHLDILMHGVETWNQWRAENREKRPDLSGADLKGINFHRADLTDVDLSGADLRKAFFGLADLSDSNLSRAKLRGVYFNGAHLVRANLYQADLRETHFLFANLGEAWLEEANFKDADLTRSILVDTYLRGANLSGTNLYKANFSGALLDFADLNRSILSYTVFASVDLSNVIGLENVMHSGPSTIGIDTIYRSGGNIPKSFLRGCGVAENLIAFMASLNNKAFEYHSVFISYSTKDQDFAHRLHADLQNEGVRCWFAPEDIKGGEKIHKQIYQAIETYDKLLIILSPNSMDSEWVKTEIYNARQREIEEQRRKLFPISLVDYGRVRQWQAFDADVGKDMAREIREYFIPDFSNWKDNDSYQKAFKRLLRDLQAEVS